MRSSEYTLARSTSEKGATQAFLYGVYSSPVDVDGPRSSVRLVEDQRTDAGDLPVFHVDPDGPTTGTVHEGLF